MTEKQRKRRRIAVIKILYEMSKGVCIIDEYGQNFKAMVDRKRTERFGSTDDRK